MKSTKLRLWLAVIIFILSVGIMLAAFAPPERDQQSVPMPVVTLPGPSSLVVPGWGG